MNFNEWKIENDIYLYFWIVYFKPILSYNNTYENFIETNSSWSDFYDYQNIIEENKKYIYYLKETSNFNYLKIFNDLFKKIFLPKTLKHYEKL
jgi:hypothetical protein